MASKWRDEQLRLGTDWAKEYVRKAGNRYHTRYWTDEAFRKAERARNVTRQRANRQAERAEKARVAADLTARRQRRVREASAGYGYAGSLIR